MCGVLCVVTHRQDRQKYSVLLIITDGVVNDIDATIAAIVGASVLPLSIIIVGVGNENFHGESGGGGGVVGGTLSWIGYRRQYDA